MEPNWEELIEEQKKSGLKIDEYCVSRGVNPREFKSWKYHPTRCKAAANSATFIELSGVERKPYEIRLKNGRSVVVPEVFSEPALRRLITIVESC